MPSKERFSPKTSIVVDKLDSKSTPSLLSVALIESIENEERGVVLSNFVQKDPTCWTMRSLN